jgi:hypothetical protein
MTEYALLMATGCMLLAAVLIPVPPRGRVILWAIMLGLIVTLWLCIGLGEIPPLG